MKRTLATIFLITCFVTLYGQRSTAFSNFRGGVRAGMTATQISGDDLMGFHQIGATDGLFATCPLNDRDNLKLQAEIDFTMKGSRNYTPPKQAANPSAKYVLTLGYLEMPILLKWKFARITIMGNSDFEFEAGPVFGVNIFKKERDIYGIINGRPDFRTFEFSAMAGLSWMFNEHHGLSFRFANSLIPVRIPNWAISRRIKKQYNSVLMFSYFYQF